MSFIEQPDPRDKRRDIAGLMFSVAVIVGWGALIVLAMAFAVVQFWELIR